MPGIIDMVTCFGWDRNRPTNWGFDELLRVLEKNGIERAWTLSLRAVNYAGPEGNEETLRVCSEHEALEPVAVLDPRRYFDAHDEARRLFDRGCHVLRAAPDRLLRQRRAAARIARRGLRTPQTGVDRGGTRWYY